MPRMGKPLRQWSVSLDCDTSRVHEEVVFWSTHNR